MRRVGGYNIDALIPDGKGLWMLAGHSPQSRASVRWQ